MNYVVVDKEQLEADLTVVADAIRAKSGVEEKLELPLGMKQAVDAIEKGITPAGTIEITENGEYDVTDYASANVQVEGGGSSEQSIIEGLMKDTFPSGDVIYNENDYVSNAVINFFAYRTNITSVVMEEFTGSLPSFRGCSNLTYFYFPKVTSIVSQTLNSTGLSGIVDISKMVPMLTTLYQSSFNGLNKITRIILPQTVVTIPANTFNLPMQQLKDICLLGKPVTFASNAVASGVAAYVTDIYVPWSEGEVANAPWGAVNATIHYNTTYDENHNPIV